MPIADGCRSAADGGFFEQGPEAGASGKGEQATPGVSLLRVEATATVLSAPPQ